MKYAWIRHLQTQNMWSNKSNNRSTGVPDSSQFNGSTVYSVSTAGDDVRVYFINHLSSLYAMVFILLVKLNT